MKGDFAEISGCPEKLLVGSLDNIHSTVAICLRSAIFDFVPKSDFSRKTSETVEALAFDRFVF